MENDLQRAIAPLSCDRDQWVLVRRTTRQYRRRSIGDRALLASGRGSAASIRGDFFTYDPQVERVLDLRKDFQQFPVQQKKPWWQFCN
jgi:type IV secretory pathway VirB9-like protein